MRTLALWVAMLALASAAPAAPRMSRQARGEADLARELAGRVAGKPADCVELSRLDGSHIIEGTAIVYRGLGGTIWVNRPRGAEMLREDDLPVQFVYGSQLCRLDRIKLLDRTSRMERGLVGLGEFVPYTKPAKQAH